LGELADITQNWLEARIDRGNVGVVQRGGKHRLIDAEGACDQGVRAVTVPAAIDAGYEGGDELALTGRQRRGPAHHALPVGTQFLQQIRISAPQVSQGCVLGKGTKQRHRCEFRVSRLPVYPISDASRSRPPRAPCPNCGSPWKSGRSGEDRPLPSPSWSRSRRLSHRSEDGFLGTALRFPRATVCR